MSVKIKENESATCVVFIAGFFQMFYLFVLNNNLHLFLQAMTSAIRHCIVMGALPYLKS